MRLTLRTLLSYLDDTLEPAQAKAIGAKVAESEQARELMERIKQVTRRRRLTTPPTSGPGGIDANTIAEYLDNDVTAEQAAEVEQICLASDVHLAEVAACHQILTLVLGEPALVPPTAKQRMYGLVKGPESIPFRQPAKPLSQADQDLSSEIEPDQDEALRLGVPAMRRGGDSRNLWLLIGGGTLAACLLVVAVLQLMKNDNPVVDNGNKDALIAQNGNKDGEKKNDPDKDGEKKKEADEKDKKEEKIPLPKKIDTTPENKLPISEIPAKVDPLPEVAYQSASLKQEKLGKFVPTGVKDPTVLLQAKSGNRGWERVAGKNVAVAGGRSLVSLSGSKSVVALDSGVELTLWGNLPEATQDGTVLESRATLHSPVAQLDADLTLERGRIMLRSKKDGKDVVIRVRFNDPTQGKEDFFDVILNGSDAAVILDRMCYLDQDEPFYENGKDPNRKGPTALMKFFAYEQSATIRFGQVVISLSEQQPMLQWQSREGVLSAPRQVVLPPWFKGLPELKDAGAKQARDKAVNAYKKLAEALDVKPVDVALAEVEDLVQDAAKKETIAGKGLSIDTYTLYRQVIRSEAAMDNISYLFDEFSKDLTPLPIRGLAMQTLQHWLALHRDHDYQLLEVVQKNYRKVESVKILDLLHPVSAEDAGKPVKYQVLIDGLNNELLPIRMLSHWHLFMLAPAGAKIAYDPAMPRPMRDAAVAQWTRLIPAGQLPPSGAPTTLPKKEKS